MIFILKIVNLLHTYLEGGRIKTCLALEEGTEMGLVLESETVRYLLDRK